MKKTISTLAIAAILAVSAGSSRIETGEVGLRIDASKQVKSGELMPGSFNQTLIGDVLTFPVRDVPITLENKNPLTADNTTLADFDLTAAYGINPACVSDLWTKKSKTFHTFQDGDWYLMHAFMVTTVNTAAYKAVRQYEALKAADNRGNIEAKIKENVLDALTNEKLNECLTLNIVQVRNVQPSADIVASANAVVRAQNELRAKEKEVEIAKKEAERMSALAANAGQSVAYMQAQAQVKIAEGIAAGKVHTIVVPYDFRGIVNTGK